MGCITGNRAGKCSGLIVVTGKLKSFPGLTQQLFISLHFSLSYRCLSLLRGKNARAAEDDHRTLDTQFVLREVRFEHFELKTNTAGFASQQKFWICKGESVGISFKGLTHTCLSLQIGPCIGDALGLKRRRRFHRDGLGTLGRKV